DNRECTRPSNAWSAVVQRGSVQRDRRLGREPAHRGFPGRSRPTGPARGSRERAWHCPVLEPERGQTALHRESESGRPLLEGTRRCYTTPLPDRLPDPRTGLAPEVAQLFPQEAKHVRHTAAALLGRLIRAIRAIVVLPALLLARFGRIDRSIGEPPCARR